MDIHPYCTIIRYNEDEDIDDYYDDDGNMALDTLCVLGEGVMGGWGWGSSKQPSPLKQLGFRKASIL